MLYMKSTITKTTVALAIGLVTATSPVRAESFFESVKNGTMDAAAATWEGSKAVARSVIHAPATAYHVARGDRPLFLNHREAEHRQIALSGSEAQRHYREESAARHNDPPPI
jgi:hypothetical protein